LSREGAKKGCPRATFQKINKGKQGKSRTGTECNQPGGKNLKRRSGESTSEKGPLGGGGKGMVVVNETCGGAGSGEKG